MKFNPDFFCKMLVILSSRENGPFLDLDSLVFLLLHDVRVLILICNQGYWFFVWI